MQKSAEGETQKERREKISEYRKTGEISQKSDESKDTKKELATLAGVSHDTIAKPHRITPKSDKTRRVFTYTCEIKPVRGLYMQSYLAGLPHNI